MRQITCIDMTLKESASMRDSALTFKEKLEIARGLDRLKVDVIELPPIVNGKADELSNRTIAGMVSQTLSATVNAADGNVEQTWESIRQAAHPQLNIAAPVSPVQMEYAAHRKAPAMLECIAEQVKKARFYCEDVEFTAEDATRAEWEFLADAINTAIENGASKITLCDTAGIFLPEEFGEFIDDIKASLPALEKVELYVQVSDAMDLGLACAVSAIREGATGIKCTATACGYPTLEQIAKFLQVKGTDMGYTMNLRTTELNRMVSQLAWMLKPSEESPVGSGSISLADTSGVTLDRNDEIGDVVKVIRQMGYDLSDEDNARVYEAFRRVVAKKHFVGTRELDAIVASSSMQVPSTYRIENYVINSGNVITATANILLDKDGEKMRGVGVGDGPIDAAFVAIEQIIGHHYELDDFQIQTVTEGRDAMGSALVKLRADGRVYSGSGISTDIIGASIRAYISALNKIVFDQN